MNCKSRGHGRGHGRRNAQTMTQNMETEIFLPPMVRYAMQLGATLISVENDKSVKPITNNITNGENVEGK